MTVGDLVKGVVIIIALWAFLFFQQSAHAFERSTYGIWVDLDRDCQNTRQEILIRDSLIEPIMGSKCKVNFGKWQDPYSDAVFISPAGIDIDHIIPLNYADRNGAKDWSPRRKVEFGNDPENLIAASASQNRSKGDKGPSKWMPKNKAYHCQYAKSWTKLAEKYRIKLEFLDRAKLKSITAKCK